ncbi:MAG TPA: FAD-dependent oxidoreductase, partial [Prolixibacteraceae bacterium]|nr:FAD-dependent oxidoreductase [Prolixibacteraceae bacterium]
DFTRIERYKIPYRCFYSKDINNLFMAGRCFSATHVGLGSPRVMHTTAQMGVVVGTAAVVCTEKECSPREVYDAHLPEMKNRLEKMRIEEKEVRH